MRSISNSIQIEFKDGSKTESVEIEYPIGHRRRRDEAYPLIEQKFKSNFGTKFSKTQTDKITQIFMSKDKFNVVPVHEFMAMLSKQ
jgi:2-methylcitrate dehydratase